MVDRDGAEGGEVAEAQLTGVVVAPYEAVAAPPAGYTV